MATRRNQRSTPETTAKKRSSRLLWAVAAALLAAGGAYYVLANVQPEAQAALDLAKDDVVYNRSFRAVHEMRAGPPIPFLPADQPQPKVSVPDDYYDFGRVGANAVVKREFLVRNDGEAPLTISRAYTTCGCTTAEFSTRIIPPGKAALVVLVFDAGFHDVRGQTVKRGIIIENNDRRKSKAEIWVRATVGWN